MLRVEWTDADAARCARRRDVVHGSLFGKQQASPARVRLDARCGPRATGADAGP